VADKLVYKRAYSEQGPDFAVAHRVIKRTKTRIYVDREIDNEISRAYWDEHPERRQCFTLDRQDFERTGSAWSAARRTTFFSTKEGALGDWVDEVPF
jgi:hypothetical protein